MTLQLVQSEDFLLDLEGQFHWYIHESKLDLPEAVGLAQEFKTAVLETLDFLLKNPGAGRKRFPQFADLEGTRSWRVNAPFNRFLIYYHTENEQLLVDRLIEGHRRITTDRD
jgi:plasmid stabilization system protein ParE